jgi:hypothetical protein
LVRVQPPQPIFGEVNVAFEVVQKLFLILLKNSDCFFNKNEIKFLCNQQETVGKARIYKIKNFVKYGKLL